MAKTSKEDIITNANANRVGPEQTEKSCRNLKRRLSSVPEGLVDLVNLEYPLFAAEESKELEGMVSSLHKTIDDLGSGGNLEGEEGLSSHFFEDEDNESVAASSLPSPTPNYASPIEIEPEWRIHPYQFDSLKEVLDYQQRNGPRSSFKSIKDDVIVENSDSVDYEPDPDRLPTPTHASPIEREYGMRRPEWPIHPPKFEAYKAVHDYQQKFGPKGSFVEKSILDYELEDDKSEDDVPKSCRKRKGFDDWDSDMSSTAMPKVKSPLSTTEFADSGFADVRRVTSTRGGWIGEWVMTGTVEWIED